MAASKTMRHRVLDQITLYVAAAGGLLAAGTFYFGGPRMGIGAAIGALVAVLNLRVMRFVMGRAAAARSAGQTRMLAPFVILKMLALLGVCWFLVRRLGVHPMGFMIGLSCLVVGVVVGSLLVKPDVDRIQEEA